MRVVIVVGNPKVQSRTLRIAEVLASRIVSIVGGVVERTVDLGEYANDLFRWPDDRLSELSQVVASADVLVVASPTYKASYTGLLKAFLDRYPSNGLAGVVAIPVMTAGDPMHGMAVETTLRPLLVELGASVPTRGLFFLISQLPDVERAVDDWVADNRRYIDTIAAMSRTEVER
jgi:FMN reductase